MNAMNNNTNAVNPRKGTARARIEELRRQGAMRAPRPHVVALSDEQKRDMRAAPQTGQLWLASDGDGGMAYLLVTGVGGTAGLDPRVVDVVPMTEETGLGMPGVPSVPAPRSPLCRELVPVPDLRAQIPMRLLDTPLGSLDPADTRSILEGLDAADGMPSDGEWIEDDDARNEYDHLADLIDGWRRSCGDLPALPADVSRETDGQPYDEQAGDLYDQLIDVLGLSVPQANDVYDGKRRLDEREKLALIEAGARPQDLDFAFTLPADLLVEVEGPLWHAKAAAWAKNHSGDPRLGLARECYALHARTTAEDKAWRDRLAKLKV